MKRKLLLMSVFLLSVLGASAQIRVEKGQFVKNDTPYYYVGTNFWYGPILASDGLGGDKARLQRELDSLQAVGINNLRVLVGAYGPLGVPTKVEPTLQVAAGVYNDTLLVGLDRFLAELGRRGMEAVLYLNNSWEWTGGYSQYLEWAGYGKAPIPQIDGWMAYNKYVNQYHKSDSARELFDNHVRFIVSRVNTVTGKPYSEDPAIFSWQIGNEPRPFGAENKDSFAKWIARVAALIKSIDPNHMVSIGSEGSRGSEDDIRLWERITACPDVDYANIHIWPYNWSWIGKNTMARQLGRACDSTKAYIEKHSQIAARLGKPLAIEEFGFPRDGFKFTPGSPTTLRDYYYESIFEQLVASCEASGILAGVNFWGWGGTATPDPKRVYWHRWAPYTGDPAQEEQGLNSVFTTDRSTLALIRAANGRLSQERTKLYLRLKNGPVALGHQDSYFYGKKWNNIENPQYGAKLRSDYIDVVGGVSGPDVLGCDLGHIELGEERNIDGVPFKLMREAIIAHASDPARGIVTLSWHPRNPLTGGDAWDLSSDKVVESILPDGELHEKYVEGWLRPAADFILSLRTADGRAIPIVWRPWHEHTGSWFWWGRDLCSAEQYKALWQMMYDYFSSRGIDNLIWAYSPDQTKFETYMERYPGDEYVDVLGLDFYFFQYDGKSYSEMLDIAVPRLRGMATHIKNLAAERGKLFAITETGWENAADAKWYTSFVWESLKDLHPAYILFWRNAWDKPTHFFFPYKGHKTAKDFRKMRENFLNN